MWTRYNIKFMPFYHISFFFQIKLFKECERGTRQHQQASQQTIASNRHVVLKLNNSMKKYTNWI